MREIAVCIQNSNKNVTPLETIKSVKNSGFKNVFVQWYDKDWKIDQQEQVNFCKEQGLNIIFAHLGCQNINDIWQEGEEGEKLVSRYQTDIENCKNNGIPLVIMHLVSKFEAPGPNEIGLNRIRKITDYAKKVGVKIAFENTKIKGYLEYVLSKITDEHIGVCFDIGHYHAHFKDEFPFEMFKNRIFAVHLHDNDQTDDQHLLPYDGTINWTDSIKKLIDANYQGPITLELSYRRDYLKYSIDEFYKEGYKRAMQIKNIFDENE